MIPCIAGFHGHACTVYWKYFVASQRRQRLTIYVGKMIIIGFAYCFSTLPDLMYELSSMMKKHLHDKQCNQQQSRKIPSWNPSTCTVPSMIVASRWRLNLQCAQQSKLYQKSRRSTLSNGLYAWCIRLTFMSAFRHSSSGIFSLVPCLTILWAGILQSILEAVKKNPCSKLDNSSKLDIPSKADTLKRREYLVLSARNVFQSWTASLAVDTALQTGTSAHSLEDQRSQPQDD